MLFGRSFGFGLGVPVGHAEVSLSRNLGPVAGSSHSVQHGLAFGDHQIQDGISRRWRCLGLYQKPEATSRSIACTMELSYFDS
jgi:hypothetical protein